MEHEDLLDASVEVLASNTQPEESAASLTKRIMNKLNFSSNTRVTETVLGTQNNNMYNIDSLQIFTDLYGVRPSVCYPGYVVYIIYD